MRPMPPQRGWTQGLVARRRRLLRLLRRSSKHIRRMPRLQPASAAARTQPDHGPTHLPRLQRHHHSPGLQHLRQGGATGPGRGVRILRPENNPDRLSPARPAAPSPSPHRRFDAGVTASEPDPLAEQEQDQRGHPDRPGRRLHRLQPRRLRRTPCRRQPRTPTSPTDTARATATT